MPLLKLLLAGALSFWAAAEDSETVFQSVVVKPGDTLWGIANATLKDPARWDEILKHNRLPSSDPSVALPGMTLRVPVRLIKENLRAAHLIYLLNRVSFRRKETAEWRPAQAEMELFRGDTLRTYESSRAKVRFLDAELLSLEPNSLAVIKPLRRDYDVELKAGGVFVGRSRVVTASARISPKTRDTRYSARVGQDLSTLVEVHKGLAAVEAQGQSVDVAAGMASRVRLGMAPSPPTSIPDLPEFEARAREFDLGQPRPKGRAAGERPGFPPAGALAEQADKALDASSLWQDLASLSVGVPVSGYRVQASRTQDFDRILLDKVLDIEEKVDFGKADLSPGVYWWRLATIDLLGTQQGFSEPRLYSVGLGKARLDLKTAVVLLKPAGDQEVSNASYRVEGFVRHDGLQVSVNGATARQDEGGRFFSTLKLKPGINDISIVVRDSAGGATTLTRRVVYRP